MISCYLVCFVHFVTTVTMIHDNLSETPHNVIEGLILLFEDGCEDAICETDLDEIIASDFVGQRVLGGGGGGVEGDAGVAGVVDCERGGVEESKGEGFGHTLIINLNNLMKARLGKIDIII